MKIQIDSPVIQEALIRQLLLRQGVTELLVNSGTYVTPGAYDYLREKEIALTMLTYGSENRDIRPAKEQACGRFTTLEGRVYTEKPEHMTHLHGNTLVPKTHPRIVLRGKLDSLEAAIIELQVDAREGQKALLVEELEEILIFCRSLLSCEVTGKQLPALTLLGLSSGELRYQSQHPQQVFGRGHILPSYRLGRLGAGLNQLRAQSREVELSAMAAFCRADGQMERADLLEGFNRLSSALYILMFRHTSEKP